MTASIKTQTKIYESLKNSGDATPPMLQKRIKMSPRSIQSGLKTLLARGYIIRYPSLEDTRQFFYKIVPEIQPIVFSLMKESKKQLIYLDSKQFSDFLLMLKEFKETIEHIENEVIKAQKEQTILVDSEPF